jgi:oligopeptide/dipeptide ABC transporter ATP-binding protein
MAQTNSASSLSNRYDEPFILEVKDLKKYFPLRKGFFTKTVGQVYAVDGVSFNIKPKETLGLVGESGCGKTTIGRCITKLYEPTDGQILFRCQDMSSLNNSELIKVRTQIQIIFQDPYTSLNPRLRVRDIIGESLKVHGLIEKDFWEEKVGELLKNVGLQPEHMTRYPHEFSGGQRQRIGIARALALSPQLIVADEPVSALDVSIQAQVINLLERLQVQFGLSYLIIAHDLAVVEHMADRIAVMYLGKIVELATDRELYQNPLHPYTQALISAIPKAEADAKEKRRPIIKGDVPSPINPPSGCRFHTRCSQAKDRCKKEVPPLTWLNENHSVACFLYI